MMIVYPRWEVKRVKILNREEKKVEYLELIYDLIFVYIVGRNNSLLHNVDGGFVSAEVFFAYIIGSLAIIQVWNFSTFYTNMYGRNGVRDHVFMFINMYLLYYIGQGTRLHWQSFQNEYHVAWALILINISAQYLFELPKERDDPEAQRTIKGILAALFGEAAIVLIAIPVFNLTGIQLAGVAILYGVVSTCFFANKSRTSMVDFNHLSERAMLYVVFTFGEMIIALSSYFVGGFKPNSLYFSGMCFLIVVGLFLCYELLYNRIIDRDKRTNGMGYMMLHLFLIFGMNIITTSLEFMKNEEVLLWQKTLLLIGSFLLFFGCLFALFIYARPQLKHRKSLLIPLIVTSGIFAGLMILFREQMYVNIAITVLYVVVVFLMIYRFSRQEKSTD